MKTGGALLFASLYGNSWLRPGGPTLMDEVREIQWLLTAAGDRITIRRRTAPGWAHDCARVALYRVQVRAAMLWSSLARRVRTDPWLLLHRSIRLWVSHHMTYVATAPNPEEADVCLRTGL